MHTFSESGSGVPAFLAKLWRLVEDPETNDLISWSTDGRSFIIQNQAQFAKELLPLNYKHNNMASFIRQLNMYGFHKITSIDNGGLRFDKDEMEFTHPCFQKDHPYLLEHIKRKIATSKQTQEDKTTGLKMEAVNRVLSEMKHMRGRQDSLDSHFTTMKQENEALWREIAILRQKHLKQQQIVNKLIQFLVTIVQPSRSGLNSMGNGNNKRRFQLMINDAPQAKVKKTEGSEGATIQELGEALEEVAYENEQELLTSDIPEVTSPVSIPQQSPYRPGSVNEIIEEVLSPVSTLNTPLGTARVKQEKPDRPANVAGSMVQLVDASADEQQTDDYDDGGYLVDHVDEMDPNRMQLYSDSDMLHTPMVLKEMQKQEQLKQRQQQQVVQQPKPINRGESLLKAKKNGMTGKIQKSLLTNNKLAQPAAAVSSKVGVSTKGGKKLATATKPMVQTESINVNAGPSGTSNFVSNSGSPSTSVNYAVEDFIVNEVPDDIFDDNSELEKESPMLGAFNFEGGFYNPNVNINEMKGRQQMQQQQQQQQQPPQQLLQQQQQQQNVQSGEITNDENGMEDDDESNNAGAVSRFVSGEADINRLQTIAEYGQHIDSVQTDLDSLKDLLKGEGYQFDANTLLGTASANSPQFGRVFFSPSTFDVEAINKLFSGNEDIMGYDFPMNLPDMSDTQKKNANGGALATLVADASGSNNSTGHVSPTPVAGSSNQLMTYKTVPATTAAGDYIDLNELLNLESNNEEENSILI